jgi:PAT family beta-lactamase induction signal transducer AmpG
MMTLCPKLIGGYSGTMVSAFGYERFFLVTAIMGIPVLILVAVVRKAVCRA